ncbi:MAG: enoyl-CoA hydratase/isomerase family protein [Gammaproteobacteria bacterium]
MPHLDEYRSRYTCLDLAREDGVLLARLNTRGGPLVWSEPAHRELGLAFADIAADTDNRVIVLTGAGDSWCDAIDPAGWESQPTAAGWDKLYAEGRRLYNNFLDIDAPVIAAVNGPVTCHACLPVICDVVLASTTARFQDRGHFASGVVPGDANQLVWPTVLGFNRGRYFLLTGQSLDAAELHRLGVVNEVLEPARLLPRALEIAHEFARKSPLTLRYTRRVLNQELRARMRDALDQGLALEALAQLQRGP